MSTSFVGRRVKVERWNRGVFFNRGLSKVPLRLLLWCSVGVLWVKRDGMGWDKLSR